MEGFMRWASRLLHEMHKPSTVSTGCEMWANFTRQVVSLMDEHGKSKSVGKADPLSTTRNNKLITQGEKLETSAKLWVLVSNISSPHLKRRYTRFFFFVYFAAFSAFTFLFLCSTRWRAACVKRNLKVIAIKSHGKSLLFGYYKLGFRCLELNYFLPRCFDLKDYNLKKCFEPLRKDSSRLLD